MKQLTAKLDKAATLEVPVAAPRLQDSLASKWGFPTFSIVENSEEALENVCHLRGARDSSEGKEVCQDR